MAKTSTCVDCGAVAPETHTFDTSVSTKLGWRLARRVLPDGSRTIEWRCHICWPKYKEAAARAALALRSR
jgi:hypothetical protein